MQAYLNKLEVVQTAEADTEEQMYFHDSNSYKHFSNEEQESARFMQDQPA